MDDANKGKNDGAEQQNSSDWIVTSEELDTELWNAVMTDFSTSRKEESEDFEEVDEYFGVEEDDEDEDERRRSTLRALASLRPQLAELLGGSSAE